MSDALQTCKRLWLWPVVLGAITVFGLVMALIRDGPWDLVGAVCIVIPAIISIRLIIKSSKTR